MLTGTDSLVLGYFNAHHSLWHSGTTDTRGNQLADSVSISSIAVLNTDSHTRHLVRIANTHDHEFRLSVHPYRITDNCHLISFLSCRHRSPARHRTNINLKKDDWTRYRQEIERKLSSRHLPTDYQKDEKLFRATLLKAASHNIPTGRRKL